LVSIQEAGKLSLEHLEDFLAGSEPVRFEARDQGMRMIGQFNTPIGHGLVQDSFEQSATLNLSSGELTGTVVPCE
jgi:hypothetical protein